MNAATHVENRPQPNQRYIVIEGDYGGCKILDLFTSPCVVVAETKATPEEFYNRIPGEEWKPRQSLMFAKHVCRLLNAEHEMAVAVNASLTAAEEKAAAPPPDKKPRARRKQ